VQQVKPKGLCVITGGHHPGGTTSDRETCIANRAISRTLPRSFATMIHTHVLNRDGKGVRSPADEL